MAAPNPRGGSGRKKIVIRRIEQEDARHVCFSKRRQGFFSKATDLAVMTGAQVAALAFSPGGRAFSFGHPSVDSVVERFLAPEGAGSGAEAGAGSGAADNDKKLKKLHQEFDELRTELLEVKNRAERKEEVMAKERAAGDKIAAWVDPNVRDMGDEDMAAFFAALMQVKSVVSERSNQVLLEAMHVDVSRMAEVANQLFGGSTFEFGSSSGSANAGTEIQLLVPPPQGQVFEAGMDMQQMEMAVLPPPHGFASEMNMQQEMVMELPPAQVVAAGTGIDMQQQMVMELPPAQGVTAGVDRQEMPPPPGFAAGMNMEQMQMVIPQPPGFDDDMEQIQQLFMAMPPSP